MTVVLIEGFDHLDQPELVAKGWILQHGWATVPGRVPDERSQALDVRFPRFKTSKILPSTYTSLIWGFALQPKHSYLETGTDGNSVAEFRTGTTFSEMTVGGVCFDAGKLAIRDSTGTLIATGSTVLPVSDSDSGDHCSWFYVEFKVDQDAGTAEVRLNGDVEIAATPGDFSGGAMNRIHMESEFSFIWYDDMYVVDPNGGGPHTDFLGDVCVTTLWPAADGTYTEWTPDIGTDHRARVDEQVADGDASVVTAGTPGVRDSYHLKELGISKGTVFGAQLNLYVRKNDLGTREAEGLVRQAGVDYTGPTATLANDYVFASWLLDQDPSGSDWTIDTINADEYGIELVA